MVIFYLLNYSIVQILLILATFIIMKPMEDTPTTSIIEPYKKTANEVFGFLIGLPQILSRFVFQQIVKEAYAIAQYQLKEDVIKQLSTALSRSYSFAAPDSATEYLSSYTGIEKSKLINEMIIDGNKLSAVLSEGSYDRLFHNDNLIRACECFTFKGINCNELEGERWERLENIIKTDKGKDMLLSGNCLCESENCFFKLGYETQYLKDEEEYDKLIFRLYCNGEILDTIFECIWENNNNLISQALYNRLLDECKINKFLSKITEYRYNYLRINIKNGWLYREFPYIEEEKKTGIKGLGIIPEKDDKFYHDIASKYTLLYQNLNDPENGMDMDKEMKNSDFIKMLSNDENVLPMNVPTWDLYKVSAFAGCLYNHSGIRNKIAEKTFYGKFEQCLKAKKRPKTNTIRGYNQQKGDKFTEYYKVFEDLFKNCGII